MNPQLIHQLESAVNALHNVASSYGPFPREVAKFFFAAALGMPEEVYDDFEGSLVKSNIFRVQGEDLVAIPKDDADARIHLVTAGVN